MLSVCLDETVAELIILLHTLSVVGVAYVRCRQTYGLRECSCLTLNFTVSCFVALWSQVSFEQPWQEGTNGILHLEHVNVRAPNHGPVKQFYYDVLGFGPDDRRAQNIENGSGTLWANIGVRPRHSYCTDSSKATLCAVYNGLDTVNNTCRIPVTTRAGYVSQHVQDSCQKHVQDTSQFFVSCIKRVPK